MRIYKYPLKITDRQAVNMPLGAQMLSVQMQNGVPCLWALVDEDAVCADHVLAMYGTGHPVDSLQKKFVATFQMPEHGLVWHVFFMGIRAAALPTSH